MEPLTAILAVTSHVLVSVWIQGPFWNAPPPVKLVMHESTEPFCGLVVYWPSPSGSLVRSTADVPLDDGELEEEDELVDDAAVDDAVAADFLSLLQATTVASATTITTTNPALVLMSANRLLVRLGQERLYILVEVGGHREVGDVEVATAVRDDLADDRSVRRLAPKRERQRDPFLHRPELGELVRALQEDADGDRLDVHGSERVDVRHHRIEHWPLVQWPRREVLLERHRRRTVVRLPRLAELP